MSTLTLCQRIAASEAAGGKNPPKTTNHFLNKYPPNFFFLSTCPCALPWSSMSRFLIIHCTMSEPGTTGTCVNHSHVLKHSALRCKWEGERRPGDLARPPSSSHPSAVWADNRPSISKSAFMTLSVGEQTGAERRGGSCCRCSRCSFHMLPDTASLLLWSQLVCSSVCLNDSLLSAASSPPGRFHTTTHGT